MGVQLIYDALDFTFAWTDDWYTYDRTAGEKAARKARDEKAKELRKAGKTVQCFSLPHQLRSKGGIGSGRPHIEVVSTAYGLNAS